MNDQHLEQMRSFFLQYSELTKSDWQALKHIFRPDEYNKDSHIIHPDSKDSKMLFICSGLVRCYYIAQDGKEWNKAFVRENMLSGSFSSYLLGHTYPIGMQAIEHTAVYRANLEEFEALYSEHRMIERLGRKFIEYFLIDKIKREHSFLQEDAKARYLDFCQQHAELIQRIPQYHLASYLGISEVTLSRIRGSLSDALRTS